MGERWYFSPEAVRKYARLKGLPTSTEAEFSCAVAELTERSLRAADKGQLRNGLRKFRLRGAPQLYLLVNLEVSPERPLPQVVDVLPEHGRAPQAPERAPVLRRAPRVVAEAPEVPQRANTEGTLIVLGPVVEQLRVRDEVRLRMTIPLAIEALRELLGELRGRRK